ncbi:glycosyltransferase family 4 protein [Anabaena sp. FACHB-1237]|nr:glycosyltransferase family 4 protein [Anabaena sp. FACHB-1237]
MPLKIAVVVHGRFHAFDLVRELIKQGHEVTLFTNYPKYIVEKFGIPSQSVKSLLIHGVVIRILAQIELIFSKLNLTFDFEPFFHASFSYWASHKLIQDNFDVIYVFSGIAEEIFQKLADKPVLKILVRGSSHIRTQFQILNDEEIRAGLKIDKPSDWIIAREEREYQLADIVIVLSTFARSSFIQKGIDPKKLRLLPLGAQLSLFRPQENIILARCQRILSGEPLKVLLVGTFSLRKGAIDLVEIAKNSGSDFQFTFVGAIGDDANFLYKTNSQYIEFIPKQPQSELPQYYGSADIFIFTTIEDGYAVVLSQAQVAGLPIISTTNCSAPDIIVENETGWILPIRSPDAFIERLQWCHEHRPELAQMVNKIYEDFQPRDWTNVAEDFTVIVRDYLEISAK